MKPFALLFAVLLSLVFALPAEARPVCKAVKGAAKAVKAVKVVKLAKGPLKFAKAVLPPYRR